ncbi:unnamed protein product [Amaranthus hypochondriacus]
MVPIIWSGAWLSHQSTTKCEKKFNNAFLVIGVLLLLVSLSYVILLFCKNQSICVGPFTILFFVVLGYTIFGLVITTTTRDSLTNQIHYSKWIHNLVLDNNHWRNLKNCFIFQTKLCSPFLDHHFRNDSYQHFQSRHFSSIQSGCCKPLKECNFSYVSPAVWNKPRNTTFENKDCEEWSNDPDVLCFNCESCKHGFLHDINKTLKKAAMVNIVAIISLVMLWWCADCGPDPQD